MDMDMYVHVIIGIIHTMNVPQTLQFNYMYMYTHTCVVYKEEPIIHVYTVVKGTPPSPILTCLRHNTHMHKSRTLDDQPREPGVGVSCTIYIYGHVNVYVHV